MKIEYKYVGITTMIILALAVFIACGSSGGGGGDDTTSSQATGIKGYVFVPASSREIARDAFINPRKSPAGYVALNGVVVKAQSIQTTTNSEGYFELSGLTAASNEKISFIPPSGYNPFEVIANIEGGTVSWINKLSSHCVSPLPTGSNLNVSIRRLDTSNYPTVTVTVQVYDSDTGTPVLGLTENNFTVTNAGQAVNLITVNQASQTGSDMSVALILDRSISMSTEIDDLKLAAKTFVSYMNPTGTENDRAEIVSFATDVTIDQSFTSDKALLYTAIDSLTANGATSFFDATVQGINDTTAETNPNKALIAMTDGQDNLSTETENSVINAAVNALIPVYTVGLGVSSPSQAVLQNIASSTGADYYSTPDATELQKLYTRITSRIQQEYLITYINNTPGKSELKIDVNFSQQKSTDNDAYGKNYALLIGIEDYESISDLNYTWDDVVDMHDALTPTDMWSGTNTSIITLQDSAASRAAILNNISTIAGQMTEADLFLLYFAGHGGAQTTGEQYICAWDSDITDFSGDILVSDLETALDAIPKSTLSNTYVIFDACHSGNFIGRDSYGNTARFVLKRWQASASVLKPIKTFKRDLAKASYNVMTAAAGTESSFGVSDLQNGLFTYYLTEGLGFTASPGSADANGNAMISMEEAFAYLEPLVINYSTNNLGTVQSPQSYDGDTSHPAMLKYDW